MPTLRPPGHPMTRDDVRRAVLKTRREALNALAHYDFGDEEYMPGDHIVTGNRRVRAVAQYLTENWREADRKARKAKRSKR